MRYFTKIRKKTKSQQTQKRAHIRNWKFKKKFRKKWRENDYCTDGQMVFKGHS
jgi:hypothetical protein